MLALKKGLLIVLLCAFGAAMAFDKSEYSTQSRQGYPDHEVRFLGDFSEVKANGRIDIEFKRTRSRNKIQLFGDARDLSKIEATRIGDVLYIDVPESVPEFQPLKAVIYLSYLNAIHFHGVGDITGHDLSGMDVDMVLDTSGHVDLSGDFELWRLIAANSGTINITGISSNALKIEMHENPKVKLQGVANLKKLRFDGEGDLSLYWVDSTLLEVDGFGDAKVHLAGKVYLLDAILSDRSEMDGTYLRVDKGFIKTYERSVAKLQPLGELNTLASNDSNIYYYHLPEFKSPMMAGNGAVLNFVPFW